MYWASFGLPRREATKPSAAAAAAVAYITALSSDKPKVTVKFPGGSSTRSQEPWLSQTVTEVGRMWSGDTNKIVVPRMKDIKFECAIIALRAHV